MKQLSIFIFCLLSFVYCLNSQDLDLDKLPYDDTPPGSEEDKKDYFGIGFGYTPTFQFLGMAEINKIFEDSYGLKGLTQPLTLHGGGAFTGIPIWPNIRAGFFSYSGSKETDILQLDDTFRRFGKIEYAVNGITIDYGYVLTEGLALLGGVGLGYGHLDIEVSQGIDKYDWDNIGNINDENNYRMHLENRFLLIQPNLYLEWAATKFLMIRGSVNYNLSLTNFLNSESSNGWTINGKGEIENLPSGLSSNGFAIQAGLYFGLFNY